VTPAEWTRILAEKYEGHLKAELGNEWENTKARAQCLEPTIAWYKERLDNYVEKKKFNGTFKRLTGNLDKKFIQMVRLIFIHYR
jgi:hypothetical protein